MGATELASVGERMRLPSGLVFPLPVILDVSLETVSDLGLRTGGQVLLTLRGQDFALLTVEDIFRWDRETLARQVYGTADPRHPGVRRMLRRAEMLIAGPVEMLARPKVAEPFTRFFFTPLELRAEIARRGWRRVVAHQSRNVPHTGHEWLMKSAWFASEADGVLVSAVVGEKREGDYIDEAIVLGHAALARAGYLRPEAHMTSLLLWDMHYAGPREAVFHAIVRKNLGCTHHMFGRDHAGVGNYYDPYASQRIFDELPDLGIRPVLIQEWAYCPKCQGIAYQGLCGHDLERQPFSGSLIRSILLDGVQPPGLIMRKEVFDTVQAASAEFGFGSPFVGPEYLERRHPVLEAGALR